MDLPVSQLVPKLAELGKYIASESSIYRVMRKEKLLTSRGRSKKSQKREVPRAVATRPNQLWSWDITYIKGGLKGEFYFLYMLMDVYSRKIVGWEVHEIESSELSSELVEDTLEGENAFGKVEILHSDNGAAMKGATMLGTLQRLGVVPSFSRPSVSNDNAFSEALFKTMKYVPEYPRNGFRSIEEAREWVSRFSEWYNTQHLHSGINYVTPEARHEGKEEKILGKRKRVYEEARKKNPRRWSGKTRNWEAKGEVYLNPEKGKKQLA